MSSPTQGAWECAHGVDGRDYCEECHSKSPVPAYEPFRAITLLDEICQDSLETDLATLLAHREHSEGEQVSALFVALYDEIEQLEREAELLDKDLKAAISRKRSYGEALRQIMDERPITEDVYDMARSALEGGNG